MFSPTPQLLPIQVRLRGERIEFPEPTSLLLKYVDVMLDDELLKDEEDGDLDAGEKPKSEQTVSRPQSSATKPKDDDAGKPPVANKRSLQIVSVYRTDRRDAAGKPLPLPRNNGLWLLEDVRSLERGGGHAKMTETRLFNLTFQGNNLRQDAGTKGGHDLLMALLEQAEIRLRILVDEKCLVVLKIRPILLAQAG